MKQFDGYRPEEWMGHKLSNALTTFNPCSAVSFDWLTIMCALACTKFVDSQSRFRHFVYQHIWDFFMNRFADVQNLFSVYCTAVALVSFRQRLFQFPVKLRKKNMSILQILDPLLFLILTKYAEHRY